MRRLLLCWQRLRRRKVCQNNFSYHYVQLTLFSRDWQAEEKSGFKACREETKEIKCPEKIENLQADMGLANNKRLYSHCLVRFFFSLYSLSLNLTIVTGNHLRCCNACRFSSYRWLAKLRCSGCSKSGWSCKLDFNSSVYIFLTTYHNGEISKQAIAVLWKKLGNVRNFEEIFQKQVVLHEAYRYHIQVYIQKQR